MELGAGFGGGFSGLETGQQAVTAADPSVFAIVHPVVLDEKRTIRASFVWHMNHLLTPLFYIQLNIKSIYLFEYRV